MKSRIKTALWVLLSLLFIVAGVDKLVGDPNQVRHFAEWGYPLWFLYLTGVIELGGGLSLFFPQVRFYGILILSTTMLGAVFTHLKAGEWSAFPIPLILLALLLSLAWTEKKKPSPSS